MKTYTTNRLYVFIHRLNVFSKNTSINNPPIKYLILCLGLLSLVIHFITKNLVLVMTPSIHPIILWKTEGSPQDKEYVTFLFQHDFINKSKFTVTKKIGCFENHQLSIIESIYFYCDGALIGQAKTTATDGRKLPLFKWNDEKVPKGKAFLIGSHPDSFDSRYWGFIDLNNVQRLKVIL